MYGETTDALWNKVSAHVTWIRQQAEKLGEKLEECGVPEVEEDITTIRPRTMGEDDHMNTSTDSSMLVGGGDSKGDSGGSGGSCVLDNCIEACPITPVGGILQKDPIFLHFFRRFKALSLAKNVYIKGTIL